MQRKARVKRFEEKRFPINAAEEMILCHNGRVTKKMGKCQDFRTLEEHIQSSVQPIHGLKRVPEPARGFDKNNKMTRLNLVMLLEILIFY